MTPSGTVDTHVPGRNRAPGTMSLAAQPRTMTTDAADGGRVAVVGGGAVGTTAAFDLARRGTAVTLYERDPAVGVSVTAGDRPADDPDAGGASTRAAGLCYDAHPTALDARVADRAIERFRTFDDAVAAFSFTDRPYVQVARSGDDERAAAIRESAARSREHGRTVETIDPAALAAEYPALALEDATVATVCRTAGHTDPGRYVRAAADRARAAGAEIRTGVRAAVTAGDPTPTVRTDDGREPYDAVVVAAGAHTARLVEEIAPLAVEPYRVHAAVTGNGPAGVPMLYDATGGYYLRPHPDGLLVGDGTIPEPHDPEDWTRAADPGFRADCSVHLDAALAEPPSVERAWAGLCTATPDGDPLVGELGSSGVVVATGFQGHGFMRAPAIGEAVADLATGRETIAGIERFDPDRFDGDESFRIVEGMAVGED